MNASFSLERIRSLGLKGGLSIIDQGIYSGANFVVGILLARWLMPVEYGAYAIAFAALLVFYQLHLSFIVDPMGVLGPANYPERLSSYLISQLKLHFMITLPLGLLAGLLFFLSIPYLDASSAIIAQDLCVMSLSLPFLLLPWLLRRAFYVLDRPDEAVLGSLIYAGGIFGSLIILRKIDLLSSATAILVMGVAGLLCGVTLFWRLYATSGNTNPPSFRSVFTQNWDYARWLVASSLFMVLAGQAQVFIAGHMLGVELAGVIRVMQTFTQPMILSIGAISALGMPRLTYEFARNNISAMRRKVLLVTLSLFGASVVFEILLIVFRHQLEHILYGGKFAAYVELIPIWGLTPLLLALYWGAAIGLQAAQRPQAVLIVSLCWFPVSFGLGSLFTAWWGIWGISLSAVIGYAVATLICWILYWLWVGRKGIPDAL